MGARSKLSASIVGFSLTALLLSAGPVAAQTTLFSDDFERPDGPLDGWTAYAGSATILDGALMIGPATREHWIWAGDPAEPVPPNATNVTYSVEMTFLAPGTNATVGRHAGIMFACDQPTQRYNPNGFSGYFVDWIDRTTDRGIRFTRVDSGRLVELVLGAPGSPPEPPLEWRVELDDTNIRVYGDDVLYIDLPESTYRGGFYGVWTWLGGQQVAYDNYLVTAELQPVAACFTFSPPSPVAGSDIFFDAGCTFATGTIASWEWDFGDGQQGSGETVEHTYAFGDNYTVSLTVEDDAGNQDTVSELVPVAETLIPFSDDFERAPGPVDGWTAYQGEWNITPGGELSTQTAGQEHWLWAGDPPGLLRGDFVAEFDMEFLFPPGDAVGRHAGFMFFAAAPTIRWQTNGYFFDWIDRVDDRGIRFTRMDNNGASHNLLVPGAPDSPPEPPSRWRVEVEGPTIRVFGDNILYIELEDETYREGHAGLWVYSNSQDVIFDNVVIDTSIAQDLTACFTTRSLMPVVAGEVVITFDGSCSVGPEATGVESWSWDFGDGETATGEVVQHLYASPGVYTVTLTAGAGPATAEFSRDVAAYEVVFDSSEDFERPDGVPDGWSVVQGDWSLLDGALVTTLPTTAEHWIWAGELPLVAPAHATFEYDIEFLGPGSDPVVGRHAGLQFHATRPTQRTGAGAFNGYFVDWIDRPADRGVRLSRAQNGALITLGFADLPAGGGGGLPEPPLTWRVEVDGDHIRVLGDAELYLDITDSTYRGGHFGFWTWTGDQQVVFDNLTVNGEPLSPCFTTEPQVLIAGHPVSFDGSCSRVFGGGESVVSWSWEFGDGAAASGPAAEHTYAFADTYTATLTVEDSGGNTSDLPRTLTVAGDLLPFADLFERPAGPPSGWTVFQGDWAINDLGQLHVTTPATNVAADEAWIWAGDPPEAATGDVTLEFDKEYLVTPADAVGRHGGVMLYASAPTIRWGINGYTVWWIDRVADFGVVVIRWDNGALTSLNPGTFEAVAQPPLRWRVEVQGPAIRVFGDGALLVEVEDDRYRTGYLGLWAYSNGQEVLFDNLCIQGGLVEDPCDITPVGDRFVRGDVDQSGAVNLTDGIQILLHLFRAVGLPAPLRCLDAADADDSGSLNLTDGVSVFQFLFRGGTIPLPSPETTGVTTAADPEDCGVDPTDDTVECATPPEACL